LGSDGYYCSDFCMVELYINDQYWGMYLLAEQQQINPARVDVYEPEKGYTGVDIGYFVEYDGYYTDEEEANCFTVASYPAMTGLDGQTLQLKQTGYTIKSDIYSQAQRDFIASYIENVWQICYCAAYLGEYYTFDGTYSGLVKSDALSVEEVVSAVLDVDSLVDMYILQEIACDYDITWSSFFMCTDMSRDGSKKLVFEAPWDFDSAFGLRHMEDAQGYYAANAANPWLLLLIHQDWFWDRVKAKWQEATEAGVFTGALAMIKAHWNLYADEFSQNYSRWKNMGNSINGEVLPVSRTFRTQREAGQYLYTWLEAGIAFLDAHSGK